MMQKRGVKKAISQTKEILILLLFRDRADNSPGDFFS